MGAQRFTRADVWPSIATVSAGEIEADVWPSIATADEFATAGEADVWPSIATADEFARSRKGRES